MTDPIERDGAPEEAPHTERPPEDATESKTAEATEAPEEHEPEDTMTGAGELPLDPEVLDPEATVNLTGLDIDQTLDLKGSHEPAPTRDDAQVASDVARGHLKGLLESLVFVSDKPIKAGELAKTASAATKLVKELLEELREEYAPRGIQLDEVAGGWIFRTNAAYAPFVRDLTKQKPVKLTRAQIETLSILAYRQPITRPEIDDIRGVDSGPVLKMLLERDLVKILGKKDEPGRPLLYGTTGQFLEFFGLKSLKDLPTLREFTELTDESKRVVERELGETLETTAEAQGAIDETAAAATAPMPADTLPPPEWSEEEPGTTDAPPALEDATEMGSRPALDGAEAAVDEASGEREAAQDDGEPPLEPEEEPAESGEHDAPRAVNADDEAEFPDDDDSEFDDDEDGDDEDEDEDDEAT